MEIRIYHDKIRINAWIEYEKNQGVFAYGDWDGEKYQHHELKESYITLPMSDPEYFTKLGMMAKEALHAQFQELHKSIDERLPLNIRSKAQHRIQEDCNA
jgi:hypothetical protein